MAALANGSPLAESSPTSGVISNSGKQHTKTVVASNKSDVSRKQGNPTNDPNQRRAPAQKAWTSGMNPITQRATTPSQQNGIAPQNKPAPKASKHENASGDKPCDDRLLLLFANAMGQKATITTKNSGVFSGIFFGASMEKSEPEYLLKMVQQVRVGHKGDSNGVRENPRDFIGFGEDHAMSFKAREVIDLAVEGIAINNQDRRANGAASGFRSDTEISGSKAGQERELKPWVAPPETGVGQALESSMSSGSWDQFQTNENLFGVTSDYNEDMYTTRIDKSHPNYRQREAAAQRMALRMGDSSAGESNEAANFDEEERYSAVRRETTDYPPLQSTQPNRYQPPARRPPSGKPTVAGAPVDPAIITSQIARPDTAAKAEKTRLNEPGASRPLEPLTTEENPAKTKQESSSNPSASASKRVDTDEAKTPQLAKAPAPATNPTANVENEALKAFKQFSEKQKIRVADDRRQRVIQDKNVKLNDLRGFSKNFKLNTPVPSDLVPILAKDKKKQDEIMEKAQRQAAEKAASPVKSPTKTNDQAASKPASESKRDSSKVGQAASDRSELPRPGGPPRGPQSNLPLRDRQLAAPHSVTTLPPNEQGLSQRLAKTQRNHQAGVALNPPAPLPIHTQKPPSRPSTNAPRVNSSQASSAMRTPTSATSGKFNVKANEFVPNPAANTFMPTSQPSAASSPKANAKDRSASQASSPNEFFGRRKPVPSSERPSILDNFNPLKRLHEKASKDGKLKDYAVNGGIAYAHATPVTWTNIKDGEEGKSYKDLYDGPSISTGPSPRPPTVSPINASLAHQHQLPAHLQQGPHATTNMQTAPQTMYQGPQQHLYPGMPQHFDDQRMHGSSSIPSYSTPRMQNGYGTYQGPMHQPVSGPMPGAFQYPPVMGPGHPQMMNPGGPLPPQFRQFSNGPHYMQSPVQQLAAPMMVQQGSQGPYMTPGGPIAQLPVYAPGTVPSYGPSQPTSGYPSPSRGAPMMMHQGSFQGQNAQMHAPGQQYGQPFYSPQPPPPNMAQMRGYPSPQPQYNQSPQQQYHYPQPHRVPSHGYGHHSQGGPQMPMQQHQPPMASENGEGLK